MSASSPLRALAEALLVAGAVIGLVAGSALALRAPPATAPAAPRPASPAPGVQPTPLAASAPKPVLPDAELARRGRALFVQSCAHCHGDDATGEEGPDLHRLRIGDAHIALLLQHGLKGDMPSFAQKHDAADVAALTAYLRTLH